ncbi:6625_t:CDS:2 [Funneliformis caledonium]|uniref:6625_t:CDS:1 n=1 Tax=Funneliformis caledonium TaxID=1117310 RepID=A0A9N9AE96_9GLOM|nr:6625_t:CDS:2 [Funneliformis caledonium]
MISQIRNYLAVKRYQSEVSTSSVEPWERALFNSAIILSITLFSYTAFANLPNQGQNFPINLGDYHSLYL